MSFRTGPTQTGLHSHRRWLEAVHFGFRKKRNCTIYVAKTLALISCAVTAQLICVFGFSYTKSRFSHNGAHIFTHFSLLRGLPTSCGWSEIKTGLLMTGLLYNCFMSYENW